MILLFHGIYAIMNPMLLLRTYHEDDFSTITELLTNAELLTNEDESRRLKSLLTNNYVVVCEILGQIVGFVLFFCDQGHIFTIYAHHSEQTIEILDTLIHRVQEKSKELHLDQITLQPTPNHYDAFIHLGFHPSSNSTNLIKILD